MSLIPADGGLRRPGAPGWENHPLCAGQQRPHGTASGARLCPVECEAARGLAPPGTAFEAEPRAHAAGGPARALPGARDDLTGAADLLLVDVVRRRDGGVGPRAQEGG